MRERCWSGLRGTDHLQEMVLSAKSLQHLFFFAILFKSASLFVLAGRQEDVVNVLNLAWLSTDGSLVANEDLVTSFMTVPIAIKHFNERYAGINPAFSQAMLGTCNKTLNLTNGILDDQGLSSVAMGFFLNAYHARRVDIVFGPARSDVASILGITAGALGVPLISHVASSDVLSNKVTYPTFFRVVNPDMQYAFKIAELFTYFKYKTVGVIHVEDGMGRQFQRQLFTGCTAQGIRLVSAGYDSTSRGAAVDAEMERIMTLFAKKERIGVIFYLLTAPESIIALAKAAKKLDWISGRLYLTSRNHVANNVLAQAADPDSVRQFFHGSLNVLRGYDLTNPIYKNLEREWPSFSVDDVNPYLPNNDTLNASSPYKLPQDYFSRVRTNLPLYRSITTAYDLVTAVGLAACGNNSTLTQNLRRVSFKGALGRVKFDANQERAPEFMMLFLENMRVSGTRVEAVEIGQFLNGRWTIPKNPVFSDGSSDPPMDVEPPPHEIDSLPLGAAIVGWIESFIAIGTSALTFTYVLRHRAEQVFVESQPIFLCLLAVGCVVMGFSIIPLTIQTNGACMAFPWLFSLGFTIALSSLTAKSVRVAILWYSRGPLAQRNKSVRAAVMLRYVATYVLVLVAILIAWQICAPLELKMIVTLRDSREYPLRSSVMCADSSTGPTVVFFGLVIAFVCLTVLVTMWVAFYVRNAPEKFHETRMTAIAGVCMFQVFFVGIPTVACVWSLALPRFLVLSSGIFLLCMIIMFTMFFPKIFKWKITFTGSQQTNNHNSATIYNNNTARNTANTNTGGGGEIQQQQQVNRDQQESSEQMEISPQEQYLAEALMSSFRKPIKQQQHSSTESKKKSSSEGKQAGDDNMARLRSFRDQHVLDVTVRPNQMPVFLDDPSHPFVAETNDDKQSSSTNNATGEESSNSISKVAVV